MIDIRLLRDSPELVRENCRRKLTDASLVDSAYNADIRRRELIKEVENLKASRNSASMEVATLKKSGNNADHIIELVRVIGDRIKDLDDVLRSVDAELEQAMLLIPNMAHESVPTGKSADDNVEVRRHGSCSERSFRLDHIQLGANKGIIDFDKGAKVTGSGFGYLTGLGAKLERALINYSLDKASAAGYTEIVPPFVANPQSFIGTAQLPKSADDMYFIEKDNLYLIPTAEVTITNFHRDDVLAGSTLPRTYCGYSACFRREAGSYGKDTRGFLRVHQFNKVELVQFAHPDESYSILEEMVHHVENMLVELGLTYRVLLLCSGDMTFGGAKTYDLEVWAPAEQRWLEVSSCTNFETFQARRANIRFKADSNTKPEFVHTLNGSGLAIPRILVSLLEQHQQEDGSVNIPEVLKPYCGFDVIP